MEKINVAELLKDCPKGMELDCLLCNNPIELEDVVYNEVDSYPIRAVGKDGFHHVFTSYGASYNHNDAKCVIYPKGKTTWEGFVPPCKFKDGDIVATSKGDYVFMLKKVTSYRSNSICDGTCYCAFGLESKKLLAKEANWYFSRLATEEEKAELFKAIKENGYRWNEETKTLEKLITPNFKVGDWIVTTYDKVNQVVSVDKDGDGYTLDDGVYFSGSWCNMYHLWTIQDAKDGDVLVASDGSIFLFAGVFDCACRYYAALTACNTVKINKEVYNSYWETSRAVYPATKEQRDLLFSKMTEAGYEWDAETKKLEKVSQYPQTFEECCTVLGLTELGIIGGYRRGLLTQFRNLLICRDAYWKIAGKEMELGKPWTPQDTNTFSIFYDRLTGEIEKQDGYCGANSTLEFPTEEMRDAFYENFKELINECKSLL